MPTITLGLDKGLGRIPYVVAGLTALAAKVACDFLLARAFDRPYSPLYYVSPKDAPLFHPGEHPAYWISMWAVALPFIALGVVLTLRRLKDAGMPGWLVLFFFAPFVHFLFFAFCAVAPGHASEGRGGESLQTPARMTNRRATATAGVVGAVVGLSMLLVAVYLLRSYGAALFLGAPPVSGFISGFLFSRWHRPTLSGAFWAAMLALLLVGIVVIGFALEGILCLMMAFPLVVLGSAMGAAIGCIAQRSAPHKAAASTATALLMLPVSLAWDVVHPLPASEARPIESTIIVDAPARTVWRSVVAFPPLTPPEEWIFRLGIAAPMSAVISGEGVGATRRCTFTTGSFLEPIEVWDPPRELRFGVTSSPDPLIERTLWKAARPPHLDGFLEPTRGQFVLETMPGGKTRLVGRTWYRTHMFPEVYWRAWADPIIHAIHLRVLRHVAALSEREARSEAAALPLSR